MTTYERVIFLKDSQDADEALRILDEDGPEAAIAYLSQWHYLGEHETAPGLGAGTADDTHEGSNGYVLTWNRGLGYIGLEYRTEN